MQGKDLKSELVAEFVRRQGLRHSRYDGTVVKFVRLLEKVDVQIELSADVRDMGAVKVGLFVDERSYDTALLHRRFADDWKPDDTIRQDSTNWTQNAAGVQMWFLINNMDWGAQFDSVEIERVFKICLEVVDRALYN